MPTFSQSLEQSLHRALAIANERHHQYATLEHLLLSLIDDSDAAAVMRACSVDLDKLRTGFMRALHKRPVPTPLVDDAVATVTQQVLALGEREIPSRRIGEMVMKELYKLDKVAYIRFASVYKSFQDVDDFQDAIKEVKRPSGKK